MKKFPDRSVDTAVHWLRQRRCPDCLAVAEWLEAHKETKRQRDAAIADALRLERGIERAAQEGRLWGDHEAEKST